MWEVNTEAVFHCWCRVGCLKLQFSTWRRANALAHDDGTSHFCVTSVSLMWTTPDGKCMYVCMYVCMSLSRQRISCLNSAGAWDRIWHTHICYAFPTVSVSPSPSRGTTPSFFNRQDCTMETGMYVPPSAPPELVTMN